MTRRRVHGEGSIYQRGDGRWIVAVSLGTVNGKRKRVERRAETRKEAAKILKELQRQNYMGVAFDGTQTVEQYMCFWLENVAKITRSPKSYQNWFELCNAYIFPALGRKHLDQLTIRDVQCLIAGMSESGMSTRCIRLVVAILQKALNWAFVIGLTPRDIGKHCVLPK